MSNYIQLSQLIKKWGLQKFEILNFIKEGLQPYSKNGVPIHCPVYVYRCTRIEINLRSLQRIKRILVGISAVEKEFGLEQSNTPKNKKTKEQTVDEKDRRVKIFEIAKYWANKK